MDYTVLAEALKKEIEARKDLETVLEAVQGAQGAEQVVREAQERTAAAQKAYQQAVGDRAQIVDATVKLKAEYAKLGQDLTAQYAEANVNQAKALRAAEIATEAKLAELKEQGDEAAANHQKAVKSYEAELADYAARTKAAEAALAALKGA